MSNPARPKATLFKPPSLLGGVVRAKTYIQAVPAGVVPRRLTGISEGTTSQWYSVSFDKPFLYKPVVIANAEAREGRFTEGRMKLDIFKPPDFPMLSSEIPPPPSLSKLSETLGNLTYQAWRKLFIKVDEKQKALIVSFIGAKEIRGCLTRIIWAVFDLLKDDFWMLGGKPAAELDRVINKIIPDQIKAYRDQLEASFKYYQGAFERAASQWNANISVATENLRSLAELAMNSSLPRLYDNMGLIEGLKMTPVNIRSINTRGFQFLGLKGRITVHWVAFGLVRAGEEAPPITPVPPAPPTLPFPFPPLPLPPPLF